MLTERCYYSAVFSTNNFAHNLKQHGPRILDTRICIEQEQVVDAFVFDNHMWVLWTWGSCCNRGKNAENVCSKISFHWLMSNNQFNELYLLCMGIGFQLLSQGTAWNLLFLSTTSNWLFWTSTLKHCFDSDIWMDFFMTIMSKIFVFTRHSWTIE